VPATPDAFAQPKQQPPQTTALPTASTPSTRSASPDELGELSFEPSPCVSPEPASLSALLAQANNSEAAATFDSDLEDDSQRAEGAEGVRVSAACEANSEGVDLAAAAYRQEADERDTQQRCDVADCCVLTRDWAAR